ncbi:MAG: hypothetical protein ACLP7F_17615, partial [Acidimicrobiales bacterium]
MTSTAPPDGGPEALLAAGLLDRFDGFVAELRGAGIPVSTTEVVDAMEALRYLPLEDRPALKLGLAAALVKQDGHWRMFDTMFELYFSLHYQGGEGRADGPSGPGTGTEGLTASELAELAYEALMGGDAELMSALARGAVERFAGMENRFRQYFGRDHFFRIYGLPLVFVGGMPRFQYDGYWVTIMD